MAPGRFLGTAMGTAMGTVPAPPGCSGEGAAVCSLHRVPGQVRGACALFPFILVPLAARVTAGWKTSAFGFLLAVGLLH